MSASSPSSPVSSRFSDPERRAVALAAALFGARMLGLFMLLPVLALYAAGLPGATPVLIGVAVGGYGVAQACLQIPFGIYSDRYGRRRLLLVGFLLFALGGALAAVSDHIVAVIAGRLLQGAGAVSAVLIAWVGDSVRSELRTRAMAIVGVCIGASFALALMLGPLLAAWIGVRGLFWASTGLALLGFVTIAMRVSDAPRQATAVADWRQPLADGRLLVCNAGVFCLHFVMTANFVALPFYLRDGLGLAQSRHWPLYVLALLISLVGTVALIRGGERSGSARGRVAWLPVVLLCLGQAALLAVAGLNPAAAWPTVAALGLFFVAFNFLEANLPAEVVTLAGSSQRGGAMGIYATFQYLGVAAGGLGAGLLLGVGGPPAVLGGGLGACLLLLLLRLLIPPQNGNLADASGGASA